MDISLLFKMSQPGLIQIFPINTNQGSYYFRYMGEFIILNSVGEGNFSEVFKAKPKDTNNSGSSNIFNYIIKICKKFSFVDNNSNKNPPKKILFNEICEINLLNKIMKIGNPNIIQMYDWAIDRKTCETRILMEYMPYDLRNYFSKEENLLKLDENLLKKIAFQILNGLSSLHKNRIIHFGIKPENILFDPENETIKITDFSLSQYVTYDLDKKILYNGGTYSYMPIEGILGAKKYSFSYDIWSLGCMLLEFCCKKTPFMGHNSEAVLDKIISVFGLDINSLTKFDEYCNNSFNAIQEKKRLINYIKINKKIKLINDDFCDFISKVLCINPNRRIKAEEALKHPWLMNISNK